MLEFFGERYSNARQACRQFVNKEVYLVGRLQLVIGGLLRSVGDGAAISTLRDEAVWVKGEKRILVESDFFEVVLYYVDEQLARHCQLQEEGFNLDESPNALQP